MTFIALFVLLFLLRLALRMAGNLLLIGLVVAVLMDEAKLHPEAARQAWQALSEIAARVSEFSRQQSAQPVPMARAPVSEQKPTGY